MNTTLEIEQRCILYVEDDPNDVFFLHHAFHEARILEILRVVNDGQAAIDYLGGCGPYADRNRFPFPMLVLLDLQLPLRTGIEVLQWIRSIISLRRLAVIMFTSSPHPTDVQRAYDLGVNSFIVKPASVFERAEFARELKSWWLSRNKFAPILPELSFSASHDSFRRADLH